MSAAEKLEQMIEFTRPLIEKRVFPCRAAMIEFIEAEWAERLNVPDVSEVDQARIACVCITLWPAHARANGVDPRLISFADYRTAVTAPPTIPSAALRASA